MEGFFCKLIMIFKWRRLSIRCTATSLWIFSFKTLIQVFNNSPDETAYFRMLLNRECIKNSVVMIQPSLLSYSFNMGATPALLDVSSIAADRILLLDAYFSVVVFHGMTIAQWRNSGYHHQQEHQVFPISCWRFFLSSGYSSDSVTSEFSKNQNNCRPFTLTVLEYKHIRLSVHLEKNMLFWLEFQDAINT